jgi:hypothetical protein
MKHSFRPSASGKRQWQRHQGNTQMESKKVEFQYRDRDLNRLQVALHDYRDIHEREYSIVAAFQSDTFYGNVVFEFDGMILDYYPNVEEARRNSIFELCTLLAKWLIVTGQYRNFEAVEGAEYPHLRLRAMDREGESDYVYRDEERKITLVHSFINGFAIEEHQLTRQAIADSLYCVTALNENDLYEAASMPKPLVQAELLSMINSKHVEAIKIPARTLGEKSSARLNLTMKGREYYESSSQDGGVHHRGSSVNVKLVTNAVHNVSRSLRVTADKITNLNVQSFVLEAVGCFESGYYRAAVILSWVGAVSVLYEHVIANKLTDFNTEAARRNAKWRAATNSNDLARMDEHDFLQILAAISVIGKSVKDELEARLKLRNGCGHPNNLQIAENVAAAHVESLVNNVFAQFV